MARKTRISARAGALLGSLLVVAALTAALGARDGSEPYSGISRGLTRPTGPPLAGADESTIHEAQKILNVPLFRPSTTSASDANISSVWVRSADSPQAYLEYASGMVVTVRPESEGLPTREYAEAQIRDGIPGEIVNLEGVQAFLVSPEGDGGYGSVRLVMRGAIVTAIGMGDFTRADLMEVGTSIVKTADDIAASAAS